MNTKVQVNSGTLVKSYSKHTAAYMVIICIPLTVVCFKVYYGSLSLIILFVTLLLTVLVLYVTTIYTLKYIIIEYSLRALNKRER